ncbi:MAG TPA: serine hydrolase domain-containing protein [Sphingomicrobium sp.]|jgi:CubicO group peptidase (beta-lactamase class C family)|nr:serine hydrolase domain-containing protein [Sphingomicrobium sp.]
MPISRRTFTGGALGVGLACQLAVPAFAQNSKYAAALAAIRAYGQVHLDHFRLPGLTLGVTGPDGFSTVMNFGYANADERTPITADTLFQIGSISKLTTAALLHQFAAEGKFRLNDRLSDLLPSIPFPQGNAIEVQHLLDHVAGIPGDAPAFPVGGLWTAYAPGAHWHYSNTGYEILGKLVEHFAGEPLARVVEKRLFMPLGMTRTRGAIIGADRIRYAQGYEAADQGPFALGVPLLPAAWVDVTFGSGEVASTADDMTRLLRSLANAAQGRGGMGLSPEGGRAYALHAVPSDSRAMSYGNGLMHVGGRGRSYLHHTGGMVSFSSSFHVDVGSGAGAFASSTLSAFAEYRPRLLTQFAVDALTAASAGHPLPAPPPLQAPLANAAAFVGRYVGPAGEIEVRSGSPLTLVANGQSAPLQQWDGDVFHTTHPMFRDFGLMFERKANSVTAASWGPATYVRAGSGAAVAPSNPQLAKLAGRFVNDSPWNGMAHVVERGGRLWVGTETPMTAIGNNLWRVGEDSWSPERGSFANFIDGRPQTFTFSGVNFDRHDL